MKKYRITLAALTAAMLMSFPLSALSYTGIGEVYSIKRDTIGDGLEYTRYKAKDSTGREQSAYIFEYDPAGGTLPIVSWGSTVYGKDRLNSLTNAAADDGSTVLAALNGDFYSMQTGVPLGVMINNGELVSTDDSKYAVGFTADGQAVIGKPSVKVSITNISRAGSPIEIDQINKFPTIWGVYMLTDDFASTTLSSSESLEIIIELGGELRASGSVTGYVREVVSGDCNTSIPEGCAVISVACSYEDYPLFVGFRAGDYVTINTVCEPGWENVVTAIGGGDLILDNGVIPDGIIDEDHEKTANPRTAVGLKPDGKVVFFAVDGRTQSSKGITETELAVLMNELGCVTALNLDGGGSTTVMVKSSSSSDCVYVNAPSDGSYRSLANGILLVSSEAPDNIPASLSAIPNSPVVLSGSRVYFSAYALDRAYMPVTNEYSLELIPSDEISLIFDPDVVYPNDIGSIIGGSFVAGYVPGEYRLVLSHDTPNGVIDGEVSVFVVDDIDSLSLEPSYTRAAPGSLVSLNIVARKDGRNVLCDSGSFYYTLNGTHIVPEEGAYPNAALLCDIGYLTTDGNFQTFAGVEGEVEIGIWYGDLVSYARIKVGTGSDVISDFEDPTDIANFSVSLSDGAGNISFAPTEGGYKSDGSLAIGYSYTNRTSSQVMDLTIQKGFPISPDARGIKLWVGGELPERMTCVVVDESGNEYEIDYKVTKDYYRQLGYSELTAELPISIRTGALTLKTLIRSYESGSGERSLSVDNPIIWYGEADDVPPIVDIAEHWAYADIAKLYEMTVIEDSDCTAGENGLTYNPDGQITRGEFAKLLVRWLGLDTTPFKNDGITLEADTPEDKVVYIRTAVANGMMNGYGVDENGVTIFNANAPITRQEICKVIGILLPETTNPLKFNDVYLIADWAYDGIARCFASGIVTGYGDNTFRPTNSITRAEACAILSRVN